MALKLEASADHDGDGGLLRFEMIVYGDIELTRVYDYDAKGAPRRNCLAGRTTGRDGVGMT
jgi:hypothetical protein